MTELFIFAETLIAKWGDLEDFISGVDCLPPRDVIDFTKNADGDLFIDFLNVNGSSVKTKVIKYI